MFCYSHSTCMTCKLMKNDCLTILNLSTILIENTNSLDGRYVNLYIVIRYIKHDILALLVKREKGLMAKIKSLCRIPKFIKHAGRIHKKVPTPFEVRGKSISFYVILRSFNSLNPNDSFICQNVNVCLSDFVQF